MCLDVPIPMSKAAESDPAFPHHPAKDTDTKKKRKTPLTDAPAISAVHDSKLVKGLTQKPPLKNLNHYNLEDGLT